MKKYRKWKLTDAAKRRGNPNGICSKSSYESKSLAKKAIRRLKASPNIIKSDIEIVPYYCEKCEAYHIGHEYK